MKAAKYLLLVITVFAFTGSVALPMRVNAHPGRTDANGGHNCYVGSCAGTYHYHNGDYVDDYYDRGYEYGNNDALENNHDYITSNAKTEGNENGLEDGTKGETKQLYPDAPEWICDDVDFDFKAGEYEDYISGVYDGFNDGCKDIANEVYADAYSDSYAEGYSQYEKRLDNEDELIDEENTDSSPGVSIDWKVLIGIVAFCGAVGIIVSWDNIKQWWQKL